MKNIGETEIFDLIFPILQCAHNQRIALLSAMCKMGEADPTGRAAATTLQIVQNLTDVIDTVMKLYHVFVKQNKLKLNDLTSDELQLLLDAFRVASVALKKPSENAPT